MEGGELDEVICIGHNSDDEEDGSSLDDDDDYYEDDDSVQLPEVICTGHQPDNNDINDNDNDNDDNNDDDFGWNWDEDDENEPTNHDNPYEQFTLITYDFPIRQHSAIYKNSCVVTSMEYVWNIVMRNNPPDITQRYSFEDVYKNFNHLYDSTIDGVSSSERGSLFSIVFHLQELDYEESYRDAIESDHPILTMIAGTSDGEECLHEIVIIGYNDDSEEYFYIDPASGAYGRTSYDSILGLGYSIINTK